MKPKNSKCSCGQKLPYTASPFMTAERQDCPKCGQAHNVDRAPIDIKRAAVGKIEFEAVGQRV
ncbi:MAG: hypothetical protein EOM59_18975 [Clostridia bacterium]|nr:hypothetical protein [Clostridia bacterium]